jgi:hypothetical protein
VKKRVPHSSSSSSSTTVMGNLSFSLGIEGAIVYTKMPSVIFLADEEHRRGGRRGTRSDDALLQHVVALLFDFVLQQLRVAVWLDGPPPGACPVAGGCSVQPDEVEVDPVVRRR